MALLTRSRSCIRVRKPLRKGYDICVVENEPPGYDTVLKRPASDRGAPTLYRVRDGGRHAHKVGHRKNGG
ncbi:hypothetical protein RRG08_001027 [Elysia crispata]|uniref:Uncharacterized protein n=1 Tax=Elysia crispata TaxID=231223 RepID=A0AAE1E586_9GAST|nr:hypothetical protein RRG08_001027 [Elysia crispata]